MTSNDGVRQKDALPSTARIWLARGSHFKRPNDWKAFERLARDLFAEITGDIHADLNGRNGQRQAGVDVIVTDQKSGNRIGVQCKGRDDHLFVRQRRLTENEVRQEVERAKAFGPALEPRFGWETLSVVAVAPSLHKNDSIASVNPGRFPSSQG